MNLAKRTWNYFPVSLVHLIWPILIKQHNVLLTNLTMIAISKLYFKNILLKVILKKYDNYNFSPQKMWRNALAVKFLWKQPPEINAKTTLQTLQTFEAVTIVINIVISALS